MNKHIKKLLCAAVSLAMVAGTIVLPLSASAAPATWDANAGTWKFDFGASTAVADDYIGVSADTKYSADTGYGFLGLENGFATNWLADGFEMTQGYDLQLENGAATAVTSADDDWVATTVRQEMSQDYISPIRFAMNAEKNGYYSVKITLKRADATQEAKVNLFTERRHQHLLDEPIPAEGLVYETNIHVHNLYGKSNGSHPGDNEDKMLNIVAEGKNVAISSIEVTKQATAGKTLFVLTDSTGCEQSAAIPYFPLNHCQGIGSAAAKYLSKDWALVNEGESGLNSKDAEAHWGNCKNEVKSGDVVWFEFGHNDAKLADGVGNYNTEIAKFYSEIPEGAYFLVVSPVQRKMENQYNSSTKKWSKTLAEYATAGKAFVEEQIAAGKKNIAFVDLNNSSLGFLDEQTAIINSGSRDYGWKSMNFYFNTDYTHPNDYGADNFAKLVVDEAKSVIEAAKATGATESVKTQAEVFTYIFGDARDCEANLVSDEIVAAGAGPNSLYPKSLTKVVYYDFPWLLKKIEWNEDGTPKSVTAEPVACEKDIPNSYAKGKVEIFNADGTSKGSVETTDFYDKLSTSGALTFPATEVKFDAGAGDTYKAYMVDADTSSTGTIVSNTLTEKDNIDVKEYLLQGSTGIENKEDFSSYPSVAEGGSLLNTNGWKSAGDVIMKLGKEGDINYAAVSKSNEGNSHYLFKEFGTVSSGQLMVQFDIRYKEGKVTMEVTDGSKDPNSFPPLIAPIEVKAVDGVVGVYFNGELVSAINANEWVTVRYTLDLDNAAHSATVNGVTKEGKVTALEGFGTPSPAVLKDFAMIETKKDSPATYDLTNIIIATLNTDPLPQKTATISSSDDTNGTVSFVTEDGGESDMLSYDGANAVVTSDKALDAVLIEATYTGNKLNNAKSTPIKLTEAGSQSVQATAGSKLMLWTSLSGDGSMQPLTTAINAVAKPTGNTLTAVKNSTVKVKATPADGYRFVEWQDGDNKKVADTAEYSFRLWDDITLKAIFEPVPEVSEIASYEIASTDASVKVPVTENKTVTFTVANAATEAGVDVPVDSATDATWSLGETVTGVSLNANVLTIAPECTLPDGGEKDIEIKCVCNSIEKTIKLKLYNFEYILDMHFDNGTVGTPDAYSNEIHWTESNGNKLDVTIMGRGGHKFENSPFGGKGAYHFLSGNGNRNGHSTLTPAAASDAFIMEVDLAIGEKGFAKFGGDTAGNQTGGDAADTFLVLSPQDGKLMYYDYAASAYADSGLTASTDALTFSSLYHIKATVDIKAKTETVVITPYADGEQNTEGAVTKTINLTNATAAKFSTLGVSHLNKDGSVHILIDNLTVRTAASSAQ